MSSKVLVPNRGEIAVRIARACREMGMRSVLAHAEEDRSPQAIELYDEFVSLGQGESSETYLNVERIMDAVRATGADALHPGYGFLSERAALARACEAAGVTFIGPSADAIELMGSKSASRKLMERLGVPVVPGYDGDEQSTEQLIREAEAIGFPVLIKASSGGGGKGMKIVGATSELRQAIESARRESQKSFGDSRLLLEKYIDHSRHVEVQVFGDGRGNLVHLFERDCSLQRRHQKVVEESPAPRYSDDLRDRMTASALVAAAGVNYRSAGTVEFILTPDNEYFFLEMNTRLQVEHPVTECVVGVDLVCAQLEIAAGGSIPWSENSLRQRGHAIEARIYAEDPQRGFLPQTGIVAVYREPTGPGIRVDSGIAQGSELGVRYDPLLAKVIAFAETRERSIERLLDALGEYVILGTKTNIEYLRRVIDTPQFRAGEVSTGFLTDHIPSGSATAQTEKLALIAAVVRVAVGKKRASANSGATLPTVWESVGELP